MADQDARDPLRRLRPAFPDFDSMVRGHTVVDFGCGTGHQVVALAAAGAKHVVGVEMREKLLEVGRELARAQRVEDRVEFRSSVSSDLHERFDLAISQNSMEHFAEPVAALLQIAALLRPGGYLLVTFCPTWYSPYGSHMHFFTRVPWVHLLFSERTVLAVRARFRSDGAKRYEDIEGGLNRMSLRKFGRVVAQSGLRARRTTYVPVKGLPVVTSVPVIRELLTNRVNCVLQKA